MRLGLLSWQIEDSVDRGHVVACLEEMIVPKWTARKELNSTTAALFLGAKSGNRGLNLGIATYSRPGLFLGLIGEL